MLSPLAARHNLVTTVAEELGGRIVAGVIRPGDALPSQDRLSEELQVSRPVIREAAKILESKGLLQSRPRTGMRVRDRSDWHLLDPAVLAWRTRSGVPDHTFVRDLVEVRFTVEPMAARLAAERATGEDLARIQGALDVMAAEVQNGQARVDASRFIAADLDFHLGVLAAAHNELFLQIFAPIREALKFSDRYSADVPGAKEASVPIHKTAFEAIEDRRPDDAARCMYELVARAARDLEEYLASHEPTAGGATAASQPPGRQHRGRRDRDLTFSSRNPPTPPGDLDYWHVVICRSRSAEVAPAAARLSLATCRKRRAARPFRRSCARHRHMRVDRRLGRM